MQDLVTLEQVKNHLGLSGTSDHDDNLLIKIEEAEALCLDYVKNYVGVAADRTARYAVIDGWTDTTAPPQVRAAILRMVGHLHGFRGDDEQGVRPQTENGDLPADVTMFLKRLRDPALA